MKRFTSTEMWMLLLGLLFVVVGIGTLLHPQPDLVTYIHPSNDVIGSPDNYVEQVTRTGSCIYSLLSIGMGIGLALFVIFPLRK
jgi:hypothetical protein